MRKNTTFPQKRHQKIKISHRPKAKSTDEISGLGLESQGERFVSRGVLERGQGPMLQQALTPLFELIANRRIQEIYDGHRVSIAGWSVAGDQLIATESKKKNSAVTIPLGTLL